MGAEYPDGPCISNWATLLYVLSEFGYIVEDTGLILREEHNDG